ncbi:uncharacterized protein [Odocoileus virginianus]|uniref:Uncharacterized protein n=1 Tax=Odocoileus virginianus TaxID=9874 RepID=A0ABM4J3C6_ODOVR
MTSVGGRQNPVDEKQSLPAVSVGGSWGPSSDGRNSGKRRLEAFGGSHHLQTPSQVTLAQLGGGARAPGRPHVRAPRPRATRRGPGCDGGAGRRPPVGVGCEERRAEEDRPRASALNNKRTCVCLEPPEPALEGGACSWGAGLVPPGSPGPWRLLCPLVALGSRPAKREVEEPRRRGCSVRTRPWRNLRRSGVGDGLGEKGWFQEAGKFKIKVSADLVSVSSCQATSCLTWCPSVRVEMGGASSVFMRPCSRLLECTTSCPPPLTLAQGLVPSSFLLTAESLWITLFPSSMLPHHS